jgi:hypothetical protein
MLNSEETAGALTAGRSVSLSGKSYDEASGLAARVEALGAKLFVAGDTSSGSGEEEFMEGGVIGVTIAVADVDGAPVAITRAAIEAGLAKARALDWSSLADVEGLGEITTQLLSWGPLPAASLSVGVRHAAHETDDGLYDKPADAKYRFFSMQNMSQEWGPEGVDGVRVASVEFGDVVDVDLSPDAIGAKAAEVPLLDGPSLFLTARYD